MTDDFKIDISVNDITFNRDFERELIKDLKKLNYAQAFMWLAIKFINEKVNMVTAKQLSDEVWGGKDTSICIRLLLKLSNLKVLKTERKPGTKIRYFKLAADKKIFKEYYTIAMERIQKEKEAEKDGRTC